MRTPAPSDRAARGRVWRAVRATAAALVIVSIPGPASAQRSPATLPEQPPAAADPPKTKEQLEAQQHFQRAKELYSAGSYREAITELEAARGLDPKGKDLVFNLGIVHERLGKYDEAIAYFRQYMEMETVTSAEKAKAETIIKRIEGAKREIPVAPVVPPSTPGTTPPPTTPTEKPAHGRIDAATITAASIAGAGLLVGTTFGIIALSSKPGSDFVTGRDGSYADLEDKTSSAHTKAIVADIGLGVGIVAAAVTAYLYFSRTKDPKAATAPSQGRVVPNAGPLAGGGGAIMIGGTFR